MWALWLVLELAAEIVSAAAGAFFTYLDLAGRQQLIFPPQAPEPFDTRWAAIISFAIFVALLLQRIFRQQFRLHHLTKPKIAIVFESDDPRFVYVSRQNAGTPSEYEDWREARIAISNLTALTIEKVKVRVTWIKGVRKDGYQHTDVASSPLQSLGQQSPDDYVLSLNPMQMGNPEAAWQFVRVVARMTGQRTAQPEEFRLWYAPSPRYLADGRYTVRIDVEGQDVADVRGCHEFIVDTDPAQGHLVFQPATSA